MTKQTLILLAVAWLAGCSARDTDPVGVRIQFLDGEGGALPDGVTRLSITVGPYASVADQCTPASPAPVTQDFEVGAMTDLDGNGRQEAVFSDMPYGCPLFATVEAYADTSVTHSGRADGILLARKGDRRFIDMTLVPAGRVSLLDAELDEPSFWLSATPLAETDGRVLVAGGFTTVAAVGDCTAYGGADTDACFSLTATDRAWLYDPATASLSPTRNTMGQARGMHSASLLANGHVVLVGGVESAVIIMRPAATGAPDWAGYEIAGIVPTGDALDSIEVFDPEAGAESVDADRDGDPGRGEFLPAVAGLMRHGRFGHSSSILVSPGMPATDRARVLLTGGFGTGAADTIDVLRLDTEGQVGFLTDPSGLLDALAPRIVPGSVMLGEYVYIIGGVPTPGSLGTPNLAVAERRQPSSDGNSWPVGTVNFSDFSTDHPEWVRLFPQPVRLGSGDTILVSGWYGARCGDEAGTATPTYDYTTYTTTWICPPELTADFFLDASTATPVITEVTDEPSAPHALASVTPLEKAGRAGQVLVVGGITNVGFATTNRMDLYTGSTAAGSQLDTAMSPLNSARALGAAVEMNGGKVLVVGGVIFDDTSGEMTLTALDTAELLNW
jgi:hypothetical protein